MIFKPFYAFETGCASYLFGCGGLGICAVADPLEKYVDDYAAFAEAKEMRITHVFETHVHADHRSGGRTLAERSGAIVILKGYRSLVCDPQRTVAINPTGNPGMATGGSGDVLTGLLAALIGQGVEPIAAARLGAFLHGEAGDIAAERVGEISLIASDIVDALPDAFANCGLGAGGGE